MNLLLLLAGCFIGDKAWEERADQDGDGYASSAITGGTDCNDADATIHPGAPEACDGIDSDCSGDVEDAADEDGDGLSVCGGDCDDSDALVGEGFEELCDAIDNDCDGVVDDGLPLDVYTLDADGDGYGVQGAGQLEACSTPDGYAEEVGDCAADDPLISPATVWRRDTDGDGFGDDAVQAAPSCLAPADDYSPVGGDCDDTRASVHPEVDENVDGLRCNGIDDDCNAATQPEDVDADGDGFLACGDDCDDTDPELSPLTWWFEDGDSDGYGGAAIGVTPSCESPAVGAVIDPSDCDDASAAVNPGVDEANGLTCNGIDDDCDAATFTSDVDLDNDGFLACADDCDDADPDVKPTMTWYADADGDDFGAGSSTMGCATLPGELWALNGDDCDDANAAVNPQGTWYADTDNDGYGMGAANISCPPPTHWSLNDTDCFDDDANITPVMTWYADTDMDGVGADAAQTGCETLPADWSLTDTDCAPADGTRYLGDTVISPSDDLAERVGKACAGVVFTLADGTHTPTGAVVNTEVLTLEGMTSSVVVGTFSPAADLVVSNLTVEGDAVNRCFSVDDVVLDLTNVDLDDCVSTDDGAGVHVSNGGELNWIGGEANDAASAGDGDVVYAIDSAVLLDDLTLSAPNGAVEARGVHTVDSDVTLNDLLVDGWSVQIAGGSATLTSGVYDGVDSTFAFLGSDVQIGGTTEVRGGVVGMPLVSIIDPIAGSAVSGLWVDSELPSLVGLLVRGVVPGAGPLSVQHVRVNGGQAAVEFDTIPVTMGFSTITNFLQEGIVINGDRPVALHDVLVGSPSAAGLPGLSVDVTSAAAVDFQNVYLSDGLVAGGDRTVWDTCAATMIAESPPAADWFVCEERSGSDFAGTQPASLAVAGGGPTSLMGRVSGNSYCAGQMPVEGQPPPVCFQPGIFGGNTSPF